MCWKWLHSSHVHVYNITHSSSHTDALLVELQALHSECFLSAHLQCKDYYYPFHTLTHFTSKTWLQGYRSAKKGGHNPLLMTFLSFHCHVQNVTIPCRSQELLPFLSVLYIFLQPFSNNYSSLLSHLILPSISWSTSQSWCSLWHLANRALRWAIFVVLMQSQNNTSTIYIYTYSQNTALLSTSGTLSINYMFRPPIGHHLVVFNL